ENDRDEKFGILAWEKVTWLLSKLSWSQLRGGRSGFGGPTCSVGVISLVDYGESNLAIAE
ncbi:hypothetical protein KI387_038405, partial [Taxus chinensis]